MDTKIIKAVAHDYVQDLGSQENKLEAHYFIYYTGIPGNGKTTISSFLQKAYGFIPVATDKLKGYFERREFSYTLTHLYAAQRRIFKKLFKLGINPISDSNSDLPKYRSQLRKLARDNNYIPLCIYLKAPYQTCLERVLSREGEENPASKRWWLEEIRKFENALQPPKKPIIIDTNKNLHQTLIEVKQKLDNFFDTGNLS